MAPEACSSDLQCFPAPHLTALSVHLMTRSEEHVCFGKIKRSYLSIKQYYPFMIDLDRFFSGLPPHGSS